MIRAPQIQLTLDDLELAAFKFGGTIEPRPNNRYVLIGALIDGRRVDLGPVAGPVRSVA